MAGHLQHKLPVPALIKKLAGRRPANRKTAQHEGPGTEPEGLSSLLPLQSDQLNPLRLAEFVFGDDELAMGSGQNFPDPFEVRAANRHTPRVGIEQGSPRAAPEAPAAWLGEEFRGGIER